MKDHFLWEGDNFEVFSKENSSAGVLGRLYQETQVYEGQVKDMKPDGFGRIISEKGCLIGMFKDGKPLGKVIQFSIDNTLEKQGIMDEDGEISEQ